MVKKANREYWKKRFEALEDKQYQESEAYYRDVEEQFRKVCNGLTLDIERWYQRLADNNDISLAAAKRLLKKGELDEFLWSVEEYIQKGEENSVDQRWMKELENASARHHISYLEAMKLQVRQYGELLAATMENGLTEYLHKTYSEQYYRTAVEITNGTQVGINLTRLDEKKIDAAIRYPWASDGKSFSDRIWSNKERLVQKLHTELVQNLIRGESPRTAIAQIAAEMNTSKKNAGRLIMTESAAISSRAHSQCFKELGVKQYEIVATLDSHTSEICREMDGRVFDLKDYEEGLTAPPFHPWCRTTTVPHFDDEFTVGEQRAARDEETGKTVYVPAGMKYEEWKKVLDDGGDFATWKKSVEKKIDAGIMELSEEELGVLYQYKSFESYTINDALRNAKDISELAPVQQQFVKELDSALLKMPKYEGNLIRTVNFSDWSDCDERTRDFIESFIPGGRIKNKEYWSTSKEEGYDETAGIWIYIEDSKAGRDISTIGIDEKEVLYERNTEFTVINKIFYMGKWNILLREAT